MNKIVGRVADRSACNRKENRIKRALNGAIMHGVTGARVRAEERAKWTSWGGNDGAVEHRGCVETQFQREARQSQELRRPESSLALSVSLPFSVNSTFRDVKFRCLFARFVRRERARVKTLPGFVTRFDPLTLAYMQMRAVRRYINCARREMTGPTRAARNVLSVTRVTRERASSSDLQ